MTNTTKKKPTATKKKPAPKTPATAPEAQQGPMLVQPLQAEAFKMVLSIIDSSDIKGADAGNVILLKQELARVAGVQPQNPAQ